MSAVRGDTHFVFETDFAGHLVVTGFLIVVFEGKEIVFESSDFDLRTL